MTHPIRAGIAYTERRYDDAVLTQRPDFLALTRSVSGS
jgi:hypothetical protein